MKKLFFKILIGLLIICCLAAAFGLWYAQHEFFPKKLKPLLIDAVQKSANMKIDLKDIHFSFPGGLALTNLTIYEKDIPAQKLLTVEKTIIHFRLSKLLFKKQITVNKIELNTLRIYPGPGHTFISKGDITLEGEFSYNFNDPKNIIYNGILTLKNQDIKDMPFVKNISGLNGRIKIEPDKISILELKGTSYGCPVEFAGWFENFKDPYMDLTETIDLDLSKINSFLSAKVRNTIKQMAFSGKSAVSLHTYGKFSEWPLKFNGHANVFDAEIKFKLLKNPIKSMNGAVDFNENSVSITELKAIYNEDAYTFKANLNDFNTPSVYAVLSSQEMLLEIKLRALEDCLYFDSIDGTWFNSNINLIGQIENYQNPELKLSGEAKIDLEDIQKITLMILGQNEKISGIFAGLKPKGVCLMSLFMDGLIKDFVNSEFGIKANSENINIYGLNLGSMDASVQLKEKILNIPKMDFMPYDGSLKIQTQVNFNHKKDIAAPIYNIAVDLADINLEKMVKDTAFKDKNIWGTLSGKTTLRGAGYDIKNINGQGWIMVANGHLWELPLLGGLANTLRMPGLKKIEIKEAHGDFIIEDKNISTDNLQFLSPQLNMQAKGRLGLTGELDFNVGISFAPAFADENQVTKIAKFLADETGRLIGELAVTGTIKEPKYNFVTLHLNKIVDSIKKMFGKKDTAN